MIYEDKFRPGKLIKVISDIWVRTSLNTASIHEIKTGQVLLCLGFISHISEIDHPMATGYFLKLLHGEQVYLFLLGTRHFANYLEPITLQE